MKKTIIVLGIAITTLFSMKSVNALTLNDNGDFINKKGATITAEQYEVLSDKFTDTTINILPQAQINYLSNEQNEINIERAYSITTDVKDNLGNIISTITIPATEEEALAVANNKSLHVLSDGKLHDTSKEIISYGLRSEPIWQHTTTSKRITLSYSESAYDPTNTNYLALVDVHWYSNPSTRSVDVLAIRWTTSKPLNNVVGYYATQSNSLHEQGYGLDGNNMKRTTYGIGESMNLFDTGSQFDMSMYVEFDQYVGEYVYATYQHATTGVLLSTSKSYSFGNGLGGVLVYNPSSYANYYDGMAGVKDTVATGCHIDC